MASCENNINEVKAMGNNKGGIDIGKDVAIYMSDGGRMTAKMMAPVMKKYLLDSGQMVEFPNTINVDFYKEMYWDQKTNKFHTDKEVVVKQHNPISKVYGLGFEANQDLTDIKIFKPQSNSFAIISDTTGL